MAQDLDEGGDREAEGGRRLEAELDPYSPQAHYGIGCDWIEGALL